MIFFSVPSVGQLKPETLFGKDDHFGFIQSLIGEEYIRANITEECHKYYETSNKGYWNSIITIANFLAIKKLDSNNRFNEISLLNSIANRCDEGNDRDASALFDYLLCQWQYPHPIVTKTTSIKVLDIELVDPRKNFPLIKPYIIILAILRSLLLKSKNLSFLTKKEFYWLGYTAYERKGEGINVNNSDNIAEEILLIREKGWSNWEKLKKTESVNQNLSYPLGFLRNSSILTSESSIYFNPEGFFIGLSSNTSNTIEILNNLIKNSSEGYDFDRAKSTNDKKLAFDYSNYLYNYKRFNNWVYNTNLYSFSVNAIDDSMFDGLSEEDVETLRRKKIALLLLRLSELDKASMSKRRTEQSILRSLLIEGKNELACGICNKNYPIKFLATAHIKKRKDCTEDEKRDLNIVMPACHLGCDKIYEEGYIYIDNGLIHSNLYKKETTEPLKKYITALEENRCNYFKEETAQYFKHHAKQNI
ncbi:hypothetical protein SAMN04488008_11458 [Maribacter orientalis]|uniref:HNH endonuclease n=1 Tax=Maribacter orientalis TaxID=228957 RepID=A0A1H7XC25_9FLAO|nr:hypothetical protein [Maribacter orientalis]SEM30728.1 hypothetical protein SAMN04488008_11458 [Maribacter orientalis]